MTIRSKVFYLFVVFLLGTVSCIQAQDLNSIESDNNESDIVFQIGHADSRSAEFQKYYGDWEEIHKKQNGKALRYVVGKNQVYEWCPIHISTRDLHAKGLKFTYEIEFNYEGDLSKQLYLVVGIAWTHKTEQSNFILETNGIPSDIIRLPVAVDDRPNPFSFNSAEDIGVYEYIAVPVPQGALKQGSNVFSITLDDGSWLFYDYIALREKPEPLQKFSLLEQIVKDELSDVDEIVFAVRKPGIDPHWYANFGFYPTFDPNDRPFHPHGGGELRVLNLKTNQTRTLIEDSAGSFRDPMVSYDGKKVLFSYLKSDSEHYNLYEINVDGSNLRQLTFGDDDDIEPTYLPNGDIVFCSTRCNRFVQCWLTPVATIYRCDSDGKNIRQLSCNIEQDNTPFVLPNGQILYTRWEYVDRSQVHYHHLWTMNPDGTRQQVFYGNQTPGDVYIDAKSIPNSNSIITIVSPGHGIADHRGRVAILDPKLGPDDMSALKYLTQSNDYTDPWAFSEQYIMATRFSSLVFIQDDGFSQPFYTLTNEEKENGYRVFEPRPIVSRVKETTPAELQPTDQTTGTLVLSNIYLGRHMQNVPKGSIKELLVLETLPEPIHYSGGMDMISLGGTFTLEKILGTVPVSPEGSCAMKLPANRSLFFIAIDHEGRSVKRMHSFTSVMPGETTSCIGCHEKRTDAPGIEFDKQVFDVANKPIAPTPIEGIPDVFDFIRDIQPLLDKHCVECHNADRYDAKLDLSHTWTVMHTLSYWELSRRNMFGDNRNRPQSDFAPYEIGSQASKLYQMILDGHQGVKFSDSELKTMRYWLEVGAPYAGTYAANGTGQIGWYYMNQARRNDLDWPENKALTETVIRRCEECHPHDQGRRIPRFLSEFMGWPKFFNFSTPEMSRVLRAPLAKEKGGLGLCYRKNEEGATTPVFDSNEDADYQTILKAVQRGRDYLLHESPHFSLGTFRPNPAYTKAMIKYGILPKDFDLNQSYDVYEIDRAYWKSFDLEEQARKKSQQ